MNSENSDTGEFPDYRATNHRIDSNAEDGIGTRLGGHRYLNVIRAVEFAVAIVYLITILCITMKHFGLVLKLVQT